MEFCSRNCYLENEKQLQFFKVYNKVNCEHECLTQMTIRSCGCVQFFMVRNESTRICGSNDENCFIKVEKNFENNKQSCACYDPCKFMKYDIRYLSTDDNED